MTRFARRVLNVVGRIPPGRVLTYGDVARLAGRPGAARAVGNLMRAAEIPGLPYHRVVAAGGRVGGYGRSPHLKIALLAAEGLTIRRRRIAGFALRRWRPPARARRGSAPPAGPNEELTRR
jgi:methylated-DNA-[protein]-cysteine S-methyltransferase